MKRKCEIWKAGMLKDSMGSFAFALQETNRFPKAPDTACAPCRNPTRSCRNSEYFFQFCGHLPMIKAIRQNP